MAAEAAAPAAIMDEYLPGGHVAMQTARIEACDDAARLGMRVPKGVLTAEVDRALGDGSHADGVAMYDGTREGYTGDHTDAPSNYAEGRDARKFCEDVVSEVFKARAAFPGNGSLITGLALGEESGEAQRALLHIWEGKGGESDLYLECVQTAAMALRLALEWQDRRKWAGNVKCTCGYDNRPCQVYGHVLPKRHTPRG